MFAASLSALAGFADASGFIHLGGYFVSFMSGNSTRLGVGLAAGLEAASIAGGLIGLFVLGVIAGSLLNLQGDKAGGVRVLIGVSAALAVSAVFASLSGDGVAIALLVCAMGGMNAVFQRDGEVTIGVTYMTGTLVRMGQRIAAAITGGPKWNWTPYLVLWGGLAGGAACGALSYGVFGLACLWIAAAAALMLTLVFTRLPA